jgi:endo-1,4-beta-mannosidase
MIRSEEAVAAEFDGPSRAISLFNRLQGLKRQKQRLEDQQGLIFRDEDRDRVIQSLDGEIIHMREELGKEVKISMEDEK